MCGAADRTIPATGNEIAYAGRLRATVDGRASAFAGTATDVRMTELRVVPGAAVALTEAVMLAAEVPILQRTLQARTTAALAPVTTSAVRLGDPELRASFLAYRSGPSTPSRRLVVFGGAKAPVAPIERDGLGRLVPTDLQPGCGSIVPEIGATFTWSGSLVSFWTSAMLLMPVAVREGPHPGDSLRASATVQLQASSWFAARAGVHGRLDAAGDVDGQIDTRAGGGSVYVAPEIALRPSEGLVVSVGASFPVAQGTRGHRATWPVALVGAAYDF